MPENFVKQATAKEQMTLDQSDDKQQRVRNVSFRHVYFFNLYAYLQAQRSHKKRDIAKDIKVMTA